MAWLTWVPGTARLLQYGSFSQVSVWAFFIVMCVELGRVPGRSDEKEHFDRLGLMCLVGIRLLRYTPEGFCQLHYFFITYTHRIETKSYL